MGPAALRMFDFAVSSLARASAYEQRGSERGSGSGSAERGACKRSFDAAHVLYWYGVACNESPTGHKCLTGLAVRKGLLHHILGRYRMNRVISLADPACL